MLGKLGSYALRSLKVIPKLVLGSNAEAVGGAMRAAVRGTRGGSIFSSLKAAGKAGLTTLEAGPKGTAFLKAVGKDIWGLPGFLKAAAKTGYTTAKAAGKSGIWGGIKGLFSGTAKKMPLIGTLLMIGCELPNIFRATSDKGIGEGLAETGKAAARLTGAAAGAAIGSAICPVIGSLIGWVAGEWLTGLVTGKTYTEQKEEAEAQAKQQALVEEYKQLGLSNADIQYCLENGISPQDALQILQKQQQDAVTNPAQTSQNQPVQQTNTGYNPAYPMPSLNPFNGATAYNYNGIGNSYSNDMFYQQLFGPDSNILNQTSYTSPYMMYPQQTFQYTV